MRIYLDMYLNISIFARKLKNPRRFCADLTIFNLFSSRRTETALASVGVVKLAHFDNVGGEYGRNYHLAHTLVRLDCVGLVGHIAKTGADFAPVIAVDYADAV